MVDPRTPCGSFERPITSIPPKRNPQPTDSHTVRRRTCRPHRKCGSPLYSFRTTRTKVVAVQSCTPGTGVQEIVVHHASARFDPERDACIHVNERLSLRECDDDLQVERIA